MEAPEQMNPAGGTAVSTQQQLQRLERELAQSRQALEDFTASVSHDLRAPLRHFSAFVQIAREDLGDGVDPEVAAHLDKAADSAAHLGQLMDGLLELARIGRAELQPEPVDLARLVDDIRHQMQGGLQGREVVWQVAPDLPLAHGDVALLHQLVARLLDNALKFTRDCPQARIEISGRSTADGGVEIQVRDNGVGFDPRQHDRLFRPFQRLHSAKAFDGIGIGLALARRVAERHGGTIAASGEVGKGCSIRVRLPPAHA